MPNYLCPLTHVLSNFIDNNLKPYYKSSKLKQNKYCQFPKIDEIRIDSKN